MGHRIIPEFQEISAGGEWERSEALRRYGSQRSTFVLADSPIGLEDITNAYGRWGVGPNKIRILPFAPPSYLRPNPTPQTRQATRAKYHLPDRYLFYPSDFSPHKNHSQIIRSLSFIREEHGASIPVVFCGYHSDLSRNHWLQELRELARLHDLQRDVLFLGYVPDEDMSSLYADAAALVMPTFCGPTLIPVLEAWLAKCPLITSNIRGVREQVGDAGLLVEPRSVESIANAIYQVWTSEDQRNSLVARGLQSLRDNSFDQFCFRLTRILEEAQARLA